MAKRVVVELQMKTIKRYSLQGFLACLCLAFFVALPIVELFLPIGIFTNSFAGSGTSTSFTMIDVIKSGFNLDGGALVEAFKRPIPYPSESSQKMYEIFIQALPIIFIVGMSVFFLQCALAIWALVLIIIFLVRGRWAHFKSPFFFSHFGLWSTFFILLLGNGLIIFATGMGVGGYREMSGAYLVFPYPGWLYTVIYFGVGIVGFLGLFFTFEYGFADRIYIGKNRRKGEPDITFFDKNNYINVTEVLTGESETAEPSEKDPEQAPEASEDKKEEKSDVIVGTTVAPVEPKVQPEPEKGIPQDINEIGTHEFSKNQNIINANIPESIDKIGDAAFSNCLSLTNVTIPKSVKRIGSNCFFNCARLTRINYSGTKAEWKTIKRGSNWLLKAGTKIVHCSDGPVQVNPLH